MKRRLLAVAAVALLPIIGLTVLLLEARSQEQNETPPDSRDRRQIFQAENKMQRK